MSWKSLTRMMTGGLAAIVLMVGIGSTTTAEAQGRRIHRPRRVFFPYRDPFWQPTYRVVNPLAERREQGYSDGRDKGKDDAKDGREFDPEDHKSFDKSHSLAYREGFLQGYHDGFRKQMKKEKGD